MKAAWPDFWGCVFEVWQVPEARSLILKVEGLALHILQGFPSHPGRPELKNATPKIKPDCLQVPRCLRTGTAIEPDNNIKQESACSAKLAGYETV